jgi:pimeloyl-ACP methyl ester carboxylesterase
MSIVVRLVMAILLLAAIALAGGWGYQRIAEKRDDRRYPPPGELHSVKGRLMHIHCRGSGSPTVIIEQGIGGPSLDWNEINGRMGQITRVCDYDRAGMGYSEPAYVPTLSVDVAKNLDALLLAAQVTDDLIFVGWSAGGMYAREYYRQFPSHVKGMVLVDSPHEQTIQRMPPQPSNQANLDRLMRNYYLAQIGWLRLNGEIEQQYADAQPEEDRKRLISIFQKSHTYRTLVDEGVGLEQDFARRVTPPKLGDLPVIVIAEGKPRHPYMQENLAKWHELQRELANLSTDGRFVVASNSAHFIHRSEPEVILKAVSDVVGAVRSGQRLASGAGAR